MATIAPISPPTSSTGEVGLSTPVDRTGVGLRWLGSSWCSPSRASSSFRAGPNAFGTPQFYAEDGHVLFADAYNHGWFAARSARITAITRLCRWERVGSPGSAAVCAAGDKPVGADSSGGARAAAALVQNFPLGLAATARGIGAGLPGVAEHLGDDGVHHRIPVVSGGVCVSAAVVIAAPEPERAADGRGGIPSLRLNRAIRHSAGAGRLPLSLVPARGLDSMDDRPPDRYGRDSSLRAAGDRPQRAQSMAARRLLFVAGTNLRRARRAGTFLGANSAAVHAGLPVLACLAIGGAALLGHTEPCG